MSDVATPAPEAGSAPAASEQPQGHHSATQPRDDAKRFAGPPGTAAPPPKLSRTVRRNGQEVAEEMTADELWAYKDKLAMAEGQNRAATERFQRAQQLAQKAAEAESVAKALAEGDYSTLNKFFAKTGRIPKEHLANLLNEALLDEEMTPEQRELAELRAEKAARAADEKRSHEERAVQEFQQQVDQLRPQLHGMWSFALEQSSLPKTEAMMESVARVFLEAAESGVHLSPEQVVEAARQDLLHGSGPLVESMDATGLLKTFPAVAKQIDTMKPEDFEKSFPTLAKAYWRHLAAKARGARRQPQAKPQQKAAAPSEPGMWDSYTGLGFR